jgi:hypothetical protein
MIRWTAAFALFLMLSGCGDDDEDSTRFGPAAALQTWRDKVSAAIDEINAVQTELERLAVGSAGQATGENLAAAALLLRPRLQGVAETLAQLEPPATLAGAQLSMLRLVALRMAGLDLSVQGWQLEQASTFAQADPLYKEAEARFEAANLLAVQVNALLAEVDEVLARQEGHRLVA